MAELYPIDQIFDNPTYPTLLANAFGNVGIPALTPEIGAPRILDHAMIRLFVEGTMNVLKHHGVITGPTGRTGRDTGVFVGNSGHTILATHGGFVEILVKLNQKVRPGQRVATQRNTFGEVVAEYTSSVAGEISGFRTDATAEPGTPLVFIFYNETPREDPVDYVE
jgi:predicted deacylase